MNRLASKYLILLAVPCLLKAQGQVVTSVPEGFPLGDVDGALVSFTSDSNAILANPRVLNTGRWRILVTFSPWLHNRDIEAQMDRVMRACINPLLLVDPERRRIQAMNPWAAFDEATVGRPMMVIAVQPVRRGAARCTDSLPEIPHLMARGLQLLDSVTIHVANNPATARLFVDGRPSSVPLVARAPVIGITRYRDTDATNQLRVFVPLDLIGADSAGRFPHVQLQVNSVADAVVDTIAISDDMLRQAWRQATPWRVERLSQTSASPPTLSLPPTEAPGLVAAHPSWLDGRSREAASVARWHLDAARVEDRRYAQVVVGATLAAAGDRPGAAIVLGDALRETPCLSLDERVDERFRSMLAPVRPGARCVAESPAKMLLRGLMVPGLGQIASSRRQWGAVFITATVTAFGYAAYSEMMTRSSYDSYQRATTSPEAARLFRQATNSQAMARSALATGVGIWLVSAIEAALVERQHAAHLRKVVDYGAPAR